MDAAAAVGLKVGYSLKDIFFGSHWCPKAVTSRAAEEKYFKSKVADFRNHSALLAWYINDELTPAYLPQLKAHQQWLIEGDPEHPSWQVLCENGEFDQYMGTFDILGSDPCECNNAVSCLPPSCSTSNRFAYRPDWLRQQDDVWSA